MVQPSKISSKTWLIFMVIVIISVLCESKDTDSRYYKHRADGEESNESDKKSIEEKLDSSESENDSRPLKHEKKSIEIPEKTKSSNSNSEEPDTDGDKDILKVTKGIRADEGEEGADRRRRSVGE